MRQYLNTLVIASITFFIGNFIGQALDSVIFRDNYSQNTFQPILSEDSENFYSYLPAVDS